MSIKCACMCMSDSCSADVEG